MSSYFDRENLCSVKLIRTDVSSIVLGWHEGEYQELFRCPRKLDDVDLRMFVNDNRYLLGFESDATADLRNVQGKKLIGYYRMYFRGGWYGRWFSAEKNDDDMQLTEKDKVGITHIIEYLVSEYPKGCDWLMQKNMKERYATWRGEENRYLLIPLMSEHYKVLVDTKYGNGDYPIRIYVYH